MIRLASIFLLLLLVVSFPRPARAGRSRPAKPVPLPLPTSTKELRQRALKALADGDVAALMRLMITPDDAAKYCPTRFKGVDPRLVEQSFDRLKQQVKGIVVGCAKLFDWKRATIVESKGGSVGKPATRCNGAIAKVSDIKVIYSAGGRRFRVKLDDPVRLGKKPYVYKLSDDPSCREIQP